MKRLNLVNLETVCWISRLGTFHLAAERLNTTQSAVSGRVRELENSTGLTLFQRHGRRMELTVHGRELVRRLEPLLHQIEDVVVSLDNPGAATGIVRIGVGEAVALSWFGEFLSKVKRLMPKVVFEVEINLNIIARQKLETGKLDVAIVAGPFDEHRITKLSVGYARFIWVMSPSLAAACPREAGVLELFERFPVWSLPRPATMFPATQAALREIGVKAVDVNTCDYLSALSHVIVAGGGLALLPEDLVAGDLASGRLVRMAPELHPEDIEFFAAWHSDQEHSVLRHVIDAAVANSTFRRRPAAANTVTQVEQLAGMQS
ncbi:LysR family transcriptional regulator [Paraburkholderia sp. RL17-337-BIB-A]|uniref:LysR family transcriptional regulator n=1 Tax=Paraburkholderia sp. RL17-337-BIB-A TaxID=3031636 RepID=UPI0038B88E32